MSKPLPNEKELYERIKKENITIHPLIWELLSHHIGNSVYAISLIAGSSVIGEETIPIPVEDGKKILNHCNEIKEFLDKIKEVTSKKKGF